MVYWNSLFIISKAKESLSTVVDSAGLFPYIANMSVGDIALTQGTQFWNKIVNVNVIPSQTMRNLFVAAALFR